MALPEPTWPTASAPVLDGKCNSMCQERDPFFLTGLFVQFMRAHFQTGNIKREALKGYIWNEDAKISRIFIDSAFNYKVQDVQRRPALLVSREEIGNMYPGLGDGQHLAHTEPPGSRGAGSFKGQDCTAIIIGGHLIKCAGQTGGEAELLGLETYFHLMENKAVLKKEGTLGKFIVTGLSPLQKFDENKENWMTLVKLSWAYSHDWTLYQDSPVLKRIVSSQSIT